MKEIFNTVFETSIRIMLLLNVLKTNFSFEKIVSLDFISNYGKTFGISEYNLHGDNDFKFSEYSVRRKLIYKAINELVLREYVDFICNSEGFSYLISEKGRSFCNSMNDEYADEYMQMADNVKNNFSHLSERELIKLISKFSDLN